MDLKQIIALAVLLFAASRLAAQGAADPNAVDLRTIMQVIDTSTSNFNPNVNLTVGDLDGDGFDDIMFGNNTNCSLHLGGAHIFEAQSYLMLDQFAVGHGAFRKQGLQDLITTPTGVDIYYDSNTNSLPFFSVQPSARFAFKSYLATIILGGISDYEGIGIPYVIAAGFPFLNNIDDPYILLYRGGTNFGNAGVIFPIDSVRCHGFPTSYIGTLVASFIPSHLPSIIYAESDTVSGHTRQRIWEARHDALISNDSLILLSNSDSGGVRAQNIYSMDITGDGIADLLVSDGDSIFIYKGNDNFGNYQLTRHNAYYIIKSPKYMDLQFELMSGFGGYMHTCGDLTGSGAPVLMATGQTDDQMGGGKTFAFFYCGGKALDSLYDAIYSEDRFAGFTVDTLNAIDVSGRNACVFQSAQSSGTNYLLYKDADKIPHRTNPNLGGVTSSTIPVSTDVRVFPSMANRFIKIDMDGIPFSDHLSVKVLNILGAIELSCELTNLSGSYDQEFDVSGLANGVYVAEIHYDGSEKAVRFIIQR